METLSLLISTLTLVGVVGTLFFVAFHHRKLRSIRGLCERRENYLREEQARLEFLREERRDLLEQTKAEIARLRHENERLEKKLDVLLRHIGLGVMGPPRRTEGNP